MSYSMVVVVGNLTRDPEVRFGPSGTSICSFTVAVNRKYKTTSGESREDVSFIDCTAFDKIGNVVSTYAKKGSNLLVQGKLRQDNWKDNQTGQERSKLCVHVDNVQLNGSKQDADSPGSTAAKQPTPRRAHPDDNGAAAPSVPGGEEDDVPF